MKKKAQETYLRGIPICRGVVIGKPFFFAFEESEAPEFGISDADIENEINRYRRAVEKAQEDVERLRRQLEEERIYEGAAILESHREMMQDPLLASEVEENIREQKKNCEFVFQSIIKRYQVKFSMMADPLFRERFKDLQDISRRVMNYLMESAHFPLADLPEGSVIFASEFTPSDIAEANRAFATALISASGGVTSHAAIVAKAKGIPYVSNVNFERLEVNKERLVIVDGRVGDVILNPTEETVARYEKIRDNLNRHIVKLDQARVLMPETFDGYAIKLSANIDVVTEAELLHKYGGNGVGLFRSEFVFLSEESFPTEEQQFEIYRDIVLKMKGLPIVIRTFDVGGDKPLPSRKFSPESNPYLGCRAIRFLLKEREIFKSQLRAILRASAFGEVSIMFPMISTLSELIEAKELVYEAMDDLRKNGCEIAPSIRIGCMVEVPSAAIISDLLARECDFLSIGTNDLVQYALAVDRDNHSMSELYAPTHPSVLRLIKLVVSEANQQGIPVSVCGEVAGDPRFTPLLLGLGVHELSVASRFIPVVKNAIRNTSIIEASRLAEKVISLSTSAEIEELLSQNYKQNVPDDCFYNP